MIEGLTLAAVGDFLKKYWIWFALALFVIVVLLWVYHAGGSSEVVKQQDRTIQTQIKVNTANENSSAIRVEDTVKLDQQKQELQNAIDNASNDDDARRKSGCVVLRQQGRDTATIPACR